MTNSNEGLDGAAITAAVADHLIGLQNADGGWGYLAGETSCTEATALAVLALRALAEPPDLAGAGDWLAARQRGDGFVTAGPVHEDPSWTTPLAGMAMSRLGNGVGAQRAADALLSTSVRTFSGLLAGQLYGYDTTLSGWAWTAGDFSFVEPTALAMIFLKQQGYAGAARVREAARLLRNRALDGGGWNYGEPEVLGGRLYPTIAPTAAALLALADEPDGVTAAARAWLAEQHGQISSLFSLGWAAMALRVLGDGSDAWAREVVHRWDASPADRRGPLTAALVLLALTDAAEHPFLIAPA